MDEAATSCKWRGGLIAPGGHAKRLSFNLDCLIEGMPELT
jgi:hypothetical protein